MSVELIHSQKECPQTSTLIYNMEPPNISPPVFFQPSFLQTHQKNIKHPSSVLIFFIMGSLRCSVSSNAFVSKAPGSMDFQSNKRRAARMIRCKPCFKVISAATAQVSGAEEQAAQAGGHMKKSKTLYDVLGLSRGASPQDVKTAYRKLARQFHPDAAVSAQAKSLSTEMFLQIQNAYTVLSKPEERAQYDRQLLVQQRQSWSRRFGMGAYVKPSGHVGRNWETDQCW